MPEFDLDAALAVNNDGTPLRSACCGLRMQACSWATVRPPTPGLRVTGQCPCGRKEEHRYDHTGFTRAAENEYHVENVEGQWHSFGADCPVCDVNTSPWEVSWHEWLNDQVWFITQPHECHEPGGESRYCRVKEHYKLAR